jgi:geranylgeranyl reductase family protein
MTDVVVVGAGPAGSATAMLLARRGHDVTLLDKARFPRPKPCAEYLSPAGAALLRDLGVDTGGGRWLRGMQLVAPNAARHLVEYGDGFRALSIERRLLDARLLALARDHGVRVCEGQRVDGVVQEDGAVRGVVARSEEMRAACVVAADGVNSTVARALHLRRKVVWPPRLGLVAHVRGVSWPEDVGQMWVGRHAYVGVAPVGERVLTLGLVQDAPRGRLGASHTALQAGLAPFAELGRRLAGADLVEPVQGVGPLAHAVRATAGRGWLLVGDAAGFFDPLTGEGLFRALKGAHLAADAVDRALGGDRLALPGYQRARRRAFAAKERLTALIQLFVRVPGLMNYVVARLQQRPTLARRLARVLGDLEPADTADLWALLGP